MNEPNGFLAWSGFVYWSIVAVLAASVALSALAEWLRARREQWGPRLDDTQEWPRIEDTGPDYATEWQHIVDSFTQDERGAA